MKKLSILLLLPFFIACSSDNDETEPKETPQDYTSFVFVQTVDNVLTNCVAAHLDENKNFIRIAELGTINLDSPSKEIKIVDVDISEIYLFTDFIQGRFDATYKLNKNKKNIFNIEHDTKGIKAEDTADPKQYPQ